MKFNEDLEGREFYELCQMYRHARDGATPDNPIHAARAFELLKAWIRGDDSDPVLQDMAESYRGM